MQNLDDLLYKWIVQANERREDLDLPIGLIEESIAILKETHGADHLEELLISDSSRVAVLDDETNPLRKWLLSARIDSHIIQTLELAAYLKAFQQDPSLRDKIEKLKRDKFWPIFFELAMATRLKRACEKNQTVTLNAEGGTTGDFTISVSGNEIPCECSRLGRSPQVTEPEALTQNLCDLIADKTEHVSARLCIKIQSSDALTGHTYNQVLQLMRRVFADAKSGALPTVRADGPTRVSIEYLTEESEQVRHGDPDFDAAWDSGLRLHAVPAKNSDEVTARFDRGETFRQYETLRLFMKFGRPSTETDHYSRLTARLRKKLKQTKISDEHLGKIVLVEVPFNFRTIDELKLKHAVHDAAKHSHKALAVILASREGNPQMRHHYSQTGTFNETALRTDREEIGATADLLNRALQNELKLDPILGDPYRRDWVEAQARARQMSTAITE